MSTFERLRVERRGLQPPMLAKHNCKINHLVPQTTAVMRICEVDLSEVLSAAELAPFSDELAARQVRVQFEI